MATHNIAGNERKSESSDAVAFLKAARNGNIEEIEAILDHRDVGIETISTDGVRLINFTIS